MSFTGKSFIIDIATNWGSTARTSLRSVEFKFESSLLALTEADFTCYVTTRQDLSYRPKFAFDTSLSKTGTPVNTSWLSTFAGLNNNRIICVFDTPQTFDEVVINNGHDSGGSTDRGSKDVLVYISDDEITSTVYGEAIPNSQLIFDGQFTEHPATDTIDDQSITLIIPPTIVSALPISTTTVISAGISIAISAAPILSVASISASVAKVSAPQNPSILFYFILTGAADGLDDIQIPIQSFQATHRSGRPSYLSVVVPGTDYSAHIAARANGQLVIRMAKLDGVVEFQVEEILRVDLEEIRPDTGSVNKKITLTGHGTATTGGQTIVFDTLAYKSGTAGKRRFRLAEPNIYIKAGDTATHAADSILIDSISYSVSATQQTMELSE